MSARRWVAGKLAIVAAACLVTVMIGLGATAASGRAAAGRIAVLAPNRGAVIVAPNAAAARGMRVGATLSIGSAPRVTVRLNGHPIAVPASAGRVRIVLDTATGLVVGQNLLWVSADRSDGTPTSVIPVRFVVGYRAAHALGVGLRLGAGSYSAAIATLRAPRTGVSSLTVRLNGAVVKLPVMATFGGRHVLNLAELGAVHRGVNHLRVRLVMSDGRVDDAVRTFRLDHRRNIAIARLELPAAVGRTAVLDARRSLIVPGVPQARGVRWTLVSRPHRSRARLHVGRGGRITLRPDAPGNYLVALLAGTGSRRGYDLLRVSASYPEPLVPLNTIAFKNGVIGVQVENQFYPDTYVSQPDGPAEPAPVQVVVLERDNLQLQANVAYNASSQAFDDLGTYLKGLPNTDLVIITHPNNSDPLPSDSLSHLDNALHSIGGTMAARWTFDGPTCWAGQTDNCLIFGGPSIAYPTWTRGALYGGSFTIVGIPGLDVGQAWRATAAQSGAQDGRINGYLTLGTSVDTGGAKYYTVINGGPNQDVAVNTCVGSTSTCPVQIGSQSYPTTPGLNGIHVVAVDRATLAPILNRTVTTTANLLSALMVGKSSGEVGHFVPSTSMDDQRLIILQSVGPTGQLTGAPTTQLLQLIDELGGTPELLLGAVSGAHRYALVGAATNLPWRNTSALESSTAMDTSPPLATGEPTGQIAGALELDRDGLYAPLAGDPVGLTNVDLYRILYQSATAWPFAGDPALPYIANGIGLSAYPDVRSAYEQLLIDFGTKAVLLSNLTCTGQSFCGDDFDAVKKELLVEFDWVQSVHQLAQNLLSPYEQAGSAPYFDVQEVTDEILASIPPPPTENVTMKWLKIVTDVMAISSGIAKLANQATVASVFGIISSAGTLGTAVMEEPNGAQANAVTSAAKDLAEQMSHQEVAYTNWVDRMEGTLLYDYGKLSAVGTAVGVDPGWLWNAFTTTSDAITTLEGTTRASAYTALIPTSWSGYNLKPDGQTQTSSDDVTTLICDGAPVGVHPHSYPFAGAVPQNQFHAATTIAASTGAVVNQVWTFANLSSSNWASDQPRTAQLPSTELTDNIYGPTSTGSSGAFQYGPIWWRDTYNPPGFTLCADNFSSSEFPPPPITPPTP